MDMSTRRVRWAAALSAAGWVGMFAAGGAGQELVGHYAGVVYHLALLPVIAALPIPEGMSWSRVAGFVWVLGDTMLDVAVINGLSGDDQWALRLGIHLSTAVWITGASLASRRSFRWVGLALAASLAGHALVGPYVPEAVLALTAFPLMLAWLILIARGKATVVELAGSRPV